MGGPAVFCLTFKEGNEWKNERKFLICSAQAEESSVTMRAVQCCGYRSLRIRIVFPDSFPSVLDPDPCPYLIIKPKYTRTESLMAYGYACCWAAGGPTDTENQVKWIKKNTVLCTLPL